MSTVKLICYPLRCPLRTKEVLYGIRNEPRAINSYLTIMKQNHQNFNLILSGLVISGETPQFAATPDGLVDCTCCDHGCVEVKCPYNLIDKTLEEYSSLPSTCLIKNGDTYLLNKKHVQNYMVCFVLFKHFECRAKTGQLRVTIKIGQSINLYAALQITN